jgi:hypothetical protein
MKSPYERRRIRLGQCTWRRTAMSMPRTADDACWSAICKGGGRAAKAILKNLRVLHSLISTGFPRTNGEANRATDCAVNSWKREARLGVVGPFLRYVLDRLVLCNFFEWLCAQP